MENKCIIIGAGDYNGLHTTIHSADFIIAADAGLKYCNKDRINPNLIIGDFDSLGYTPFGSNIITLPVEKDDTDILYAIKIGLKKGYKYFDIYGGTGGSREDHTIANLQCLLYLASHEARGRLFGMNYTYEIIKNERKIFDNAQNEYCGDFSVFCLGEPAKGITICGFKYEVENIEMRADTPIGVSNSFVPNVPQPYIEVLDGTLILYYLLGNNLQEGSNV
jgi:thiamine pyrophosphokinase